MRFIELILMIATAVSTPCLEEDDFYCTFTSFDYVAETESFSPNDLSTIVAGPEVQLEGGNGALFILVFKHRVEEPQVIPRWGYSRSGVPAGATTTLTYSEFNLDHQGIDLATPRQKQLRNIRKGMNLD